MCRVLEFCQHFKQFQYAYKNSNKFNYFFNDNSKQILYDITIINKNIFVAAVVVETVNVVVVFDVV